LAVGTGRERLVKGTRQQRARGGSGQTREEGGQVRSDAMTLLPCWFRFRQLYLVVLHGEGSAWVQFIPFQKNKFEKIEIRLNPLP
jgi:hypothetical protein